MLALRCILTAAQGEHMLGIKAHNAAQLVQLNTPHVSVTSMTLITCGGIH